MFKLREGKTKVADAAESIHGLPALEHLPTFDELHAEAEREICPDEPVFEAPKWWWSTRRLIDFDCEKAGGWTKRCDKKGRKNASIDWLHGWNDEGKGKMTAKIKANEVLFVGSLGALAAYLLATWTFHGLTPLFLAATTYVSLMRGIYWRFSHASWARALWKGHVEDRERRINEARQRRTQLMKQPVSGKHHLVLDRMKASLAALREANVGAKSEISRTIEDLSRKVTATQTAMQRLASETEEARPELAAVMRAAREELAPTLEGLQRRREKLEELVAAAKAGFDAYGDRLNGLVGDVMRHRLIEEASQLMRDNTRFILEADKIFARTASTIQSEIARFHQQVFQASAAAASLALNEHDVDLNGALEEFRRAIDTAADHALLPPPALPEPA